MRYDDHIIDQVQSSANIVDVISQFVTLKKAGSNFKGLCPFHDEKTPSFMVSAEKQIFHCFGCGAGGNVFGFLMQHENMSFPEALRELADKAGIKLPEKSRGGGARPEEGRTENEKLYEIYRLAADYYSRLYWQTEAGKAAQTYFLKRGFDESIAKEFEVGWAGSNWRGLFEYLSKKGVPEALLLKARLINRSEKGTLYDIFRSRLLFPIHNLQGKVVAFGGRLIDDKTDGPKYLNSPEHPVFFKRKELYGLWHAKRHIDREIPRIIVVEGYLDFLRLYSNGFKAVVATLGTALSDDHVHVLKRFVQEAVVVYDGDKAGQAAALRGLEVFLEGGLNVKLVTLPEGLDPDDFLLKKGPDAFRELMNTAQDFFEFKMNSVLSRFNPRDSLGLVRITDECFETLSKVENSLVVERYLNRLAGVVNIDPHSLRTEFFKFKNKRSPSGAASQPPAGKTSAAVSPVKPQSEDEILMLGLIIEEKSYRDRAFAQLEESDFSSPLSQDLFKVLKRMHEDGGNWNWPQIINRIENQNFKKQLVAAASFEWIPQDKEKAFTDCLKFVRKKRILRRLDELRRQIVKAEQTGDRALAIEYTREYQTLLQQTR